MKIEFRISFEGKVYFSAQQDYSEDDLMDFLARLEKDRAKTIGELAIDPGDEGREKGIESISLFLGKEAAERTGIFVMTYKDKDEKSAKS